MDGFEINKFAGAVLVAGILTMVIGMFGDVLVPPHGAGHGPGAGQAPTAAAPPAPAIDPILPLLASADVAAGEASARKCIACHTFEQGGANKIGPNLWNTVGADKAHMEGFAYSSALAGMGGTWTYQNLDEFLFHPSRYVRGTKMSFAGIKDTQERANLVAYMRTFSDDPVPLPTEEEVQRVLEEAKAEPVVAAENVAAAVQPAETAPQVSLGELLAAADVAAGEKSARKCVTCHSFEQGGPNKIGPNLWNTVGAEKASHEGYAYSAVLGKLEGVWTFEELSQFIENPRAFAPGNKMTFVGIKDPKERANILAYMRSLSDDPQPLPQ